MYNTRDLERIRRQITSIIDDELSRVGIFYRIFSRIKTPSSFSEKLVSKGGGYYDGVIKRIQDVIGIRVILYFSDDIPIVYNYLKTYLNSIDETVDKNEETKFAPTRINLICRIPDDAIREFQDILRSNLIDTTYEIQLRTILSEGWHEVDHDLRYKCKSDWEANSDLARNFNGILASLETSEYSILRLFEELSYRHYKNKNIIASLRTKFRLRISNYNLSPEFTHAANNDFYREIFKLERTEVVKFIFESKIIMPLTLENLLFIINHKFIGIKEISQITPSNLIEELNPQLFRSN